MAETLEQKAHRLLAESRLTVTRVTADGLIVASCRGFSDGQVYALGFDPRGGGEWRCTCEANKKFGRRCSHLMALQLVTVKPTGSS